MIEVQGLTKIIKGKEILKDITVSIQKGECLALIGPNGAGKSTLISCLLGDKKVTRGQILIQGHHPKEKKIKSSLALLQQDNTIPSNLKVTELIAFFKAIADNPLSDQKIDDLLRFTDQQKNQLAEKLSGGQRRLLSFVLVLIGQAELLLLDEPTAGMDTSTRKRFWEIIDHLKEEGKTILYTSHYIEEVEHTADRILILHEGQLLRDTTPFALGSEEKEITLSISYKMALKDCPSVFNVNYKKDSLKFRTKDIEAVWDHLSRQGLTIADIQIQNKSLLDTLFDQTEGERK
ncbi:ABC transporter ATP-binding protein [Streptococcus catagoni]|uniref:ABC transporter ATP-binding protein n=1 Tax=Streptococcus catagoni TaxID=2654874 RepID=UPI00140DE87E|nr:ABC transporter ATP-binding protein [Streptococcus catagoni]